MTKKITLPANVIEAIESMRRNGDSDTSIVYTIEDGSSGKTLDEYFFDVGTPDELMQALVNGYEVEPRKELPIVSVENFGALNLLAHHYRILQPLLKEYYYAELDDLVNNGYRTEDGRRYDY